MKLPASPQRILLTSLLAAGLAIAPGFTRADENDDDDVRGGEVSGTELLESDVDLVPGPNAPVEAGAPGISGKGFLRVTNDGGVTTASLFMQIFGLAFGDYIVTSVSLADGTTVTQLGTFTLAPEPPDPVLEEGDEVEDAAHQIEDEDPKPDPNEDVGPFIGEDSYVSFGGDEGAPFPAGFNPLDIGKIVIRTAPTTDASGHLVPGVVVLTADFSQPEDGVFTAEVEVEGDEAAPAAAGTVLVRSKYRKGRAIAQRFALAARGLPSSLPVVVTFNDGKSLKFRTTRKGTLGITRLPSGVRPASLHKVQIKAAKTGQPVASVYL